MCKGRTPPEKALAELKLISWIPMSSSLVAGLAAFMPHERFKTHLSG
jgi:hypothetical protein